ncbi:hypothetical protein [Hymenobacter rigui]|uniref:Uncharacterized protein n=1 Tax=Hymenobacter rigui TaxID=334424 RepID=A0A428KX35_9BACT|nr:hypothetical protein [Hymenobacter rigui]RSK51326.1 hypothetical protein EI291_03170 [Hymenobacter rigui]
MRSFTALLPRLRFALITATLLMVLGLNHQAVATLRVLPAGHQTRLNVAPRTAVVKQRVNLEATSPLGFYVAPAADAWLPLPVLLPVAQWRPACSTGPQARPSAVPDFFRTRLLLAALSPQAP